MAGKEKGDSVAQESIECEFRRRFGELRLPELSGLVLMPETPSLFVELASSCACLEPARWLSGRLHTLSGRYFVDQYRSVQISGEAHMHQQGDGFSEHEILNRQNCIFGDSKHFIPW